LYSRFMSQELFAMRDPKQTVGRRTMLAGVGTVGALTAAAALLPTAQQPVAGAAAPAKPEADTATGYRLTEHVKRYYQTTRV
jgi:hypothetical protein